MVAYHYLTDGSHIVFKRYFASRKQAKEWLKNGIECTKFIMNIVPINSVVPEKEFEKCIKPLFNTLIGFDLKNDFLCCKLNPKIVYFLFYEGEDKFLLKDYDKNYDKIFNFSKENRKNSERLF